MEKFTYISYEEYQTTIPKAPYDVRLSDVKDFIQKQSADLEYHFKTKNNKGDIVEVEVTNDDQPIPLLEGRIVVKTILKETKVTFQIIDEDKRKIEIFLNLMDFDSTIPISSKKPKTLEDVKRTIPDDMQNFLKNGQNIKFFFEEEQDDVGFVKKEIFQDSTELPLVESTDGSKVIKCWIMISSDLSEKFQLRQRRIEMPVICVVLLLYFIISVYLCIQSLFLQETKEGGEGRNIIVAVGFMLIIILLILMGALPLGGLICAFIKTIEYKFLKKYLLKLAA